MRILVVASHPDDEMIGMAVYLGSLRSSCAIVHVTDGAPHYGEDARNAGCTTWQEYAALRRRELATALAFAGVPAEATLCLDCPDQRASWHIADHATRLAGLLDSGDYSAVFTHPYEGGHPDHDATAAAVHAAARLSKRRPMLFEFASYHAGADGMKCESFLGGAADAGTARVLSEAQRSWKRSVLNLYGSQRRVLDLFPLVNEPLRAAPSYDFSHPPHPGDSYYRRFDWCPDICQWLTLSSCAFQDLGISCVC